MNKKVKNATFVECNGIIFKSKMEAKVYKYLIDKGITPKYEEETYILSEKVIPSVPFYNRTKARGYHLIKGPIMPITYTPDFTFDLKDWHVILEVKGLETDTFPVKRNLFRKLLEHDTRKVIYFEVRTLREVNESLNIIYGKEPI